MPKNRVPTETWRKNIRPLIWKRDKQKCTHCHILVNLTECHIDHIQSGKYANNGLKNLRTLCRRCHVLRLDSNHRGMIAKALLDKIIPPNWRKYVWSD
ncbi:HNH endonuclease [Bacillus luteolus]|uniref:HNH endonuclease n=1 Tax=Litchfieldia luteola TaxID=682179 RepID=A0ABR9QNX0_9BACI|nr:HNH endonuclease [Cytobacillus luteolus]MBE4910191.1 HNH endonuclease [Cytobacillus luteolus]MBP1942240.1 5-methylcytosine-specific restriction endonuclease McrA [Cytobacillus luteolus]